MKSNVSRIPYVNLQKQWLEERNDLLPIIDKVLESAQFVGGDELDKFEENIAKLCGTKYACGLNSGTDALMLALSLSGIGKGDEVITPPNSFIASTAAIVHIGATPVFVDVLPDQNIDPSKIEAAITEKTKAIMPVHLTGRMAQMDTIMEIADHFKIGVIEDSAQSIGSKFNTKSSGSIGQVGCFSTHPLKQEDVDEVVERDRAQFNRKVREVLVRKLRSFLAWKEHTYEEVLNRRIFTLKYLGCRPRYTSAKPALTISRFAFGFV